jgi:hypothetical protein
MNADAKKGLHQDLTEEVISVAFDVSNSLGCGFLEKVYENALVVGLRKRGLKTAQQAPFASCMRERRSVITWSTSLWKTPCWSKPKPRWSTMRFTRPRC